MSMKLLFGAVLIEIFTINVFCDSFNVANLGSKEARFEKFDGVCKDPNAPMVLEQHGIRNEGVVLYMNFSVIVKREITTKEPLLTVNLQRCQNRDNLDTCENYHTFRSNKYCQSLSADVPLWGPVFKSFTPKFECPIKKGVYTSTNSKVDMTAFLILPNENYFWRVWGGLQDPQTKKDIMCLNIEAYISTKAGNILSSMVGRRSG